MDTKLLILLLGTCTFGPLAYMFKAIFMDIKPSLMTEEKTRRLIEDKLNVIDVTVEAIRDDIDGMKDRNARIEDKLDELNRILRTIGK